MIEKIPGIGEVIPSAEAPKNPNEQFMDRVRELKGGLIKFVQDSNIDNSKKQAFIDIITEICDFKDYDPDMQRPQAFVRHKLTNMIVQAASEEEIKTYELIAEKISSTWGESDTTNDHPDNHHSDNNIF
ncbi:MAG: hypothetical protein PHV78_03825 [Patescibacteria group bacterium]|nr:hypothetical protein [Patescibacteria group bacterium]MDD5121485.1 hypothetical protein [Patescibacteria group bacterium]MDD5221957.1 hypothetical protein [Patescibacteria group bacterium]MDD5396353.1 hypothetical protein [Patescibacteria group bacterium]